MVIKNKNFLTRGEEAQKEREEALKEYSREERHHFRELDEVSRQRDADIAMGDYASASLHEGRINSLLASTPDITRDRIETTEKMYRRGVRTALGGRATKEDVARHQYSTANYGAASAIASQPATRLQSQIEEAQSGRYTLNQDILKESRQLSDAGTSNEEKKRLQSSLSTKWQQLDTYAQQEGVAKAGIAIQKRQGTDLAGVYERTSGILKRKEVESIASDVRSGKAGSAASIGEDFDKKLKELTATFDELRNVIHSTTASVEEREEAEKKHKKAAEEFDKVSIQKDASMGMGGRGAGWQRAGAAMGDAGAIVGAGGGMYRQWTVTQEMDRTRLQTGAMDVANKRFFDNVSASQGDAAALARLGGGQHQRSAAFAKTMGQKEVNASGAEAVGSGMMLAGGLMAGVGGLMALTGVGTIPGLAIAGAGLGMLASQAGKAEQVSGQAAKLQSGAVRAGQELEAYNADEALFDAQNRMKTFVNQNALDFTRNSTLASRGAGGGRGKILEQMRNPNFQFDMAGLEMNQAGILSATQAGVGMMGRQFRGGEDIRRAGELTKMGMLGSPEEYMSMRGQTERSGVGAKGLEDVLAKAVAAGMDSSKHINELVQGIDSLATTRGGVSTFGGAAENMALTVQSMRASGMSESMAVQAAADMNRTLGNASAGTDLTIPNVIEYGDIQSAIPDAKFSTVERLARMTPNEFRSVTSAFGTKGEKDAKLAMGLPANMSQEDISKIFKISGKQAIGTVLGQGMDLKDEQFWSGIMTGETAMPAVGSKEYDSAVEFWNARVKGDQARIKPGQTLDVVREQFDAAATAKKDNTGITYSPADSSLERYKKVIAKNESGGNYSIKSSSPISSAYGKYQITRSTAKNLGFDYDEMVKLGGSEEGQQYQERMMNALVADQKKSVANIRTSTPSASSKYTDAQLTAGVHYAGPEKLQNWLRYGIDQTKSDPTNPGIEEYLNKFTKGMGDAKGDLSGGGEAGSDMLTAGATGEAAAYQKGLADLGKNVAIMSEAATKINPDNFKKVIDSSAEKLGGTLTELNTALSKMSDTVILLNAAAKTRLQEGSKDNE